MTSGIPGPPDDALDAAEQDAEHLRAAARLRRQRPEWVVVWSVPMSRYSASPLFRAPRGTHLTAATPGELAAQMDQAARRLRARSRRMDT